MLLEIFRQFKKYKIKDQKFKIFFHFPLDNEKRDPTFCGLITNSNLEFKGEIEMNDIFDAFYWEETGMFGGMVEDFTEDEMELSRIENDHDEWQNEDLYAFS